nr:DEAD/DEAH box helicase [uncultured Cohaesibacter sp.]
MTPIFSFSFDEVWTQSTLDRPRQGLLTRLRKVMPVKLDQLIATERPLALALAKLRVLDPEHQEHKIAGSNIFISHKLVSRLDRQTARVLGLPDLVKDLIFRAEMTSTIGSPDFRLNWWWEKYGRTENQPLTGAILGVSGAYQRIPFPIFEAIRIANSLTDQQAVEDHWLALSQFRQMLEPDGKETGKVALEGFLRDLRIKTTDSVGIDFLDEAKTDFAPLPFTNEQDSTQTNPDELPDRSGASLTGDELRRFQAEALKRGGQPSFRIGDGAFLVVDEVAQVVLDVVVKHARADERERIAFVKDASTIIADAVEEHLRKTGRLSDNMSEQAKTELIEQVTANTWTETKEWSDRVIEINRWKRPQLDTIEGSGTNWLPDAFGREVGELLASIPEDDVARILEDVRNALGNNQPELDTDFGVLPINHDVEEALSRRLASLQIDQGAPSPGDTVSYLPITHDNFWELKYRSKIELRSGPYQAEIPVGINPETQLKPHQVDALNWQANAWMAGLPGILNADEQGLGKTLQTLTFLCWLTEQQEDGIYPILIVAPTSLLSNWEDEIIRHLKQGALGPVERLYGPDLKRRKVISSGQDIQDGKARLDLGDLKQRSRKPSVVITTYQTVANYAVSLATVPFSVAVYDEIQNLKNPATTRATAATSIKADFQIALTGTPVENSTKDIWAIMNLIFAGALGSRTSFITHFGQPNPINMPLLHKALFTSQKGHPPLALRRTKEEAQPDLPSKTRVLHPRMMPEVQALRYDEARQKSTMFGLLHHIRRTSVHPGLLEGELSQDFVEASARIQATMDILRHIHSKRERALVFVENRDVQLWLNELLQIEFGLSADDARIINGDTSADGRKAIRDRFQRHLEYDQGFDVLILGPRAAGTGLTLTAANHVIHLSRWWNPAVEEQCNDRTHRIGQKKAVTVHLPLAIHPGLGRGSFDCLLHSLMKKKRTVADGVLWPTEDDGSDVKLLYGSVIEEFDKTDSGDRNGASPEPASESLNERLADRPNLKLDQIGDDIIRVCPNADGATVLIGASMAAADLEMHSLDSDAATILLTPRDKIQIMDRRNDRAVPLSVIPMMEIWPDFVLPE